LHLTKDTPPALLFYGKNDGLLKQGEEFLAKSKEVGHQADLMLADGVGHGFFNAPPWREKTLWRAEEFLASLGYLKGKLTIQAGAAPPPRPMLPATTHQDIKYGPQGCNVLDFWLAQSHEPTPVLVSVHGGGFLAGDKSIQPQLLKECLDSGISVAAIIYRFSNQRGSRRGSRDTGESGHPGFGTGLAVRKPGCPLCCPCAVSNDDPPQGLRKLPGRTVDKAVKRCTILGLCLLIRKPRVSV
jgi:hypothetical protein